MGPPRLSVIVPTHNKAERLALTLHALLGQSLAQDRFEAVIVADGCSDGTAGVLTEAASKGLTLRVIETDQLGQSAARNLGAGSAQGDVLVFVDDDVLLCPDYLSTCTELVRGGHQVLRAPVYLLRYLAAFRDPELGVPYDGPADRFHGSPLMEERITRARILTDWPWIAARCRHLNRFERLVQDCITAKPQRFPWIGYSGSGVALPRALFEQVGGYNEIFGKRWGAEALELGYRLARTGARFEHLPQILSAHMDHPRGSSIDTFDESFDLFFDMYDDVAIREVQSLIIAGDRRPEQPNPTV